MTTVQTLLLAGGMAATFAICVCCVVGLGQLHRIVEGVNQLVDLVQQADQRQRAIMANIRGRDFDPQ